MSKIAASALSALFGLSAQALYKAARADELPVIVDDRSFLAFSTGQQFTHLDALMIELTRQLQDDGGISPAVASRFVWNSIGVGDWSANARRADHWIAMVRWRNTWGSAPRGSWPITLLGPKEYWSTAHFAGSFSAIQGEIAEAIETYSADHPDSDAARILMTNVSAADRRLRKRAAEMGIDLV